MAQNQMPPAHHDDPAIRVIIVDDQAMVRQGFGALLDAQRDITVVGSAADGSEVVELVRRSRPDVILMDIRMPKLNGLDATRAVKAMPGLEHPRIIMLTTFDADEYVFSALRAGASGFLLKDATAEDLVSAVRIVAAGGVAAGAVDHQQTHCRLRPPAQHAARYGGAVPADRTGARGHEARGHRQIECGDRRGTVRG